MAEGFPQLSRGALAYTVRRAALAVVAVASFVLATTAMVATLGGQAVAGVNAGDRGGTVDAVSTTGFCWRDGIRAGQTVVALADSLSVDGWRIDTVGDAGDVHASSAAGWDAALASSWPLAAGSFVGGLLALVFVRTHRRWVVGAAATALYLAAAPLDLQGNPALSTTAMAVAWIVPALWVGARLGSGSLRAVAWIAIAAATVAWAWLRLAGDASYPDVESLRRAVAGYGTGLVVVASIVLPLMRSQRGTMVRPALAELLMLALIAGAGAVLVLVIRLPLVVAVAITAVALLALPRTRRFAARRLEHVFLADVREHVALEASEAERARLARELHDVPLQHLTSVIRRLEVVPDARNEAELLREVAQQLRDSATNLRPPVLDDLGLGAALEFLASRASTSEVNVLSVVSDVSGPSIDTRPPPQVEVAIFRIAQEAVANAVQHAHATRIRIEGEVRRDGIDVVVRDDGQGIRAERMREAARRGHLGLTSMRRRAEAVDADLAIDGSGSGTAIKVRWQR